MKGVFRQGLMLALSAWLTWWAVLRVPPAPAAPRAHALPAPVIDLTPLLMDPAPAEKPVALHPPAEAPHPKEPPPHETPPPVPEIAAASAAAGPAPAPAEERLELPEHVEVTPLAAAPPLAHAEPVLELPPPAAPPPAQAPAPAAMAAQPEARSGAAVPLAAAALAASALHEEPAGAPSALPPLTASATPSELGAPDAPASTDRSPAAFPAAAPSLAPAERVQPAEHAERPLRAPSTPAPVPAALDARPQVAPSVAALMQDPGLIAEAHEEFERGQKKGFATVLLATPEEQLDIARFFGEELVLVPRSALDPQHAGGGYFHLARTGEPRVEPVDSAPALERYRQYRDLFDYEYGRLPLPLRELRRSVLARGEIYLFAALLSPEEWALIIARRRAALDLSGRDLGDVRRFVLRYQHLAPAGFDLAVEEIVFADGTHFRPGLRGAGG